MSELKINDSGTWRNVQQVQVNDSGTWRDIQEIYVNDSGTWRTVFLKALLNATMTEGFYDDGATQYIGYVPSIPIGSMSSTAVTGGYTLSACYDAASGANNSYVIITGFGSNPGSGFFTSVTVGSTTKTSASASYSYFAGQATWNWSTLFGLDGTGTSAVLIV